MRLMLATLAFLAPSAPAGRMSATDELAEALARVRSDEAERCDVFAQASRAVVCIFDAGEPRAGGGSGVVISPDGIGLSNYHVVADFLETRRGVGGLSDGRLYPLRVLGIDPGGDIVVFRLEGRERFDFAPLGDSDALRVGQWVAAMGNPFLVAEDYTPTITLGIISGLNRYQEGQENLLEYADCIQVSTSINPGNSGGPLFDLGGRVIGINGRASFEERGRVNVGLGYAVTINQIRRFLPGLRAGRLMQHGTLGAVVRASGENLIIGAVQDFSPAEQAGVALGDELLAVSGRAVRTGNDFNNAIAILPARWPVRLSVRRDGAPLELLTRLEPLPLRASLVYPTDPNVNRDEAERILSRYHAGPPQPRAAARWEGRIEGIRNDGSTAALKVVHEPSGALIVECGDDPVLRLEARDELQADLGQHALWREWQQIVAPLLAPARLDHHWEALGGDEVDGRIVAVVQRRFESGATVQWRFDFDSGALCQVGVSLGEAGADATWRAECRSPLGTRAWPDRWIRHSASGDVTIQIERWSEPAASQPATGPATTQPGAAP